MPSDVLEFFPKEERNNTYTNEIDSENPSYLLGRVDDSRTVYDTMFVEPRKQAKIDEVQYDAEYDKQHFQDCELDSFLFETQERERNGLDGIN